MSSRVKILEGYKPVILVSPYCEVDDEFTGYITENIAKEINCYAVINNGWEKSEKVNIWQDKADCKNIFHCHENVIRQEFLEPILRFKNKILQDDLRVFIYYLEGIPEYHRGKSGKEDLDLVIGYGAGSPNSYSCEIWRKNAFINELLKLDFSVVQASKRSDLSGSKRSEINQLFRKHYKDKRVQSMKVNIIHELRENQDLADIAVEYLGKAIENTLKVEGFPTAHSIEEY